MLALVSGARGQSGAGSSVGSSDALEGIEVMIH
jgi:hypothetical protein